MKGRVCWLSMVEGYGLKGYGPKGDFFLLFLLYGFVNNHNSFLLVFQVTAFKIGLFKVTKTWLNY